MSRAGSDCKGLLPETDDYREELVKQLRGEIARKEAHAEQAERDLDEAMINIQASVGSVKKENRTFWRSFF